MNTLDLAKALWPRVQQVIPVEPERDRKLGGRPRISDEVIFTRLVLFLRAGCAWETFDLLSSDSPASGRTIRRRLTKWRQAGVFEQICVELQALVERPEIGYLDATFLRARGGGEEIGLTKHGKGSKLQVLCRDDSIPLIFGVYSANPAESRTVLAMLETTEFELPRQTVADRGYDSDALRWVFAELGSTLTAPHKSNRTRPDFNQEGLSEAYANRWCVERFNAWLAAWRHIVTRYERKFSHYYSWVCLAISLIYTRAGIGVLKFIQNHLGPTLLTTLNLSSILEERWTTLGFVHKF